MKTQAFPLLLLFTLLCFSSCKKWGGTPKEVLPAATMEGKKTFGALVNGKVWLPKGRPNFFHSEFSVVYEPGYEGGTLEIRAYRKVKEDPSVFESMTFGMSQLDREGVYSWVDPARGNAFFYSESCSYTTGTGVYRNGKLEITKLDLTSGIIAGKFEFTLAKPGCDTIRVTEGRFDTKIF